MARITRILRGFTFVFFVLFSYALHGQKQVDSLKSLLPNTQGIERVDLKNSISRLLLYQSPNEAEQFINETIEESKAIEYQKGLALAWVIKGALHNIRYENPQAKAVLEEAIALSESINYDEGLAYAHMSLGALYINTRELTKAFENHIVGIESARAIGKADLELTYLMNIGVIKQLLEDYVEAEKYLLEALKMSEKANLINRSAQIFGNLGIVELKRSNYGRSIEYQKKALKIFIDLKADTQTAISWLNIGKAESQLMNSVGAMAAFEEALKLREKMQDSLSIARVLRYKGEHLGKVGNLNEAGKILGKALTIASDFDDLNLLSEIHYLQYELNKNLGEFEHALTSFQSYVSIQDSLNIKANKAKVAELTSQFEFEKLEQDNALQQRESEIKDLKINQKNQLLAVTILLFVIAMVWTFLKRKQLKNKLVLTQKDHQLSQKELESRANQFEAEKLKLTQYAHQLLSKNQELEEKKQQLESRISSSKEEQEELDRLIEKLRSSINDDKDWAVFRLSFDALFPGFFQELELEKELELTQYEQRLLALMKISLSNKEIGGILNISRNSVVRAKHRLRQRFGHEDPKNFENYILNL